jgi:hypothetical protein
MREPVFMKLGMYIMDALAHLNGVLHKSISSIYMSICISPLSLLDNGSGKRYCNSECRRNNRRIVEHVVFCAVCVVPWKAGDWFFPELLVYQYEIIVL